MSLPLSLLIAASTAALGTAIVQEGFSFQPPGSFRTERMELFHGSEVGAVSAAPPSIERRLTTVLKDGEGASAAVMLVAIVEAPFEAVPAGRDAFSQQVVTHFASLGLAFTLDRAALVLGAASRVEVFGTLKEEGGLRAVVVSAIPGEARHVVITVAAPEGRIVALLPELRASLDSVRIDAPPSSQRSRRLFGAIAGALAGALVVSVGVWRRRRNLGR